MLLPRTRILTFAYANTMHACASAAMHRLEVSSANQHAHKQRQFLLQIRCMAGVSFASWWWRVVVTVLLSVGLMHYNTALPCCVKSVQAHGKHGGFLSSMGLSTLLKGYLWGFMWTFSFWWLITHCNDRIVLLFVLDVKRAAQTWC